MRNRLCVQCQVYTNKIVTQTVILYKVSKLCMNVNKVMCTCVMKMSKNIEVMVVALHDIAKCDLLTGKKELLAIIT